MTKLLPLPTENEAAGDIANAAGSAPVPGAGNQMQGNPKDTGDRAVIGHYAPGNQNSAAAPVTTQLSNGSIGHNSIPSNVLTAPGTDSLLAQLSRGQVILKDSTYGQSAFIPGSPPVATASVPTGQANALTYPAPAAQTFTGD